MDHTHGRASTLATVWIPIVRGGGQGMGGTIPFIHEHRTLGRSNSGINRHRISERFNPTADSANLFGSIEAERSQSLKVRVRVRVKVRRCMDAERSQSLKLPVVWHGMAWRMSVTGSEWTPENHKVRWYVGHAHRVGDVIWVWRHRLIITMLDRTAPPPPPTTRLSLDLIDRGNCPTSAQPLSTPGRAPYLDSSLYSPPLVARGGWLLERDGHRA
jgi:hypothetical protein